jgi:transcription elongation factor GreA
MKLNEVVANARVIDETNVDNSIVSILSKVKIKNVKNGMEKIYTIVSEEEADLAAGKISNSSPYGKGLFGKKVGDVAQIQAPAGVMEFEILEISR